MGEVVRKDAAAEDILSDARTTMTRATARGGEWESAATARLGPVLNLAESVAGRLADALMLNAPAEAELAVSNDEADRLIQRVSDDVWNLVGRPGHDAALDLIFPVGASTYTEGPTTEQPDRMALLADLLESDIHPRLERAKACLLAGEIRIEATALNIKVEAVRPLRVRVALANKMQQAIARATQAALSNLKRAWKADGKSEVEIHEVIPDRPRSSSKPNPTV